MMAMVANLHASMGRGTKRYTPEDFLTVRQEVGIESLRGEFEAMRSRR